MLIRPAGSHNFGHQDNTVNTSSRAPAIDDFDREPVINLQVALHDAAEEMADILSAFGRFNRTGRKQNDGENDLIASILEYKAEEKLETLIRHVTKTLLQKDNLLNLARSLFPDDSDLMLALKELLKSRQLTKLMKEKIKEAIDDFEKFSDSQKMRSGMNVGQLARNFSTEGGNQPLTAKELRSGYLRFLKLDLPCSYIYNDWIEQYGFNNRLRMLAFMMSALIIDIKALVPGIHYEEFGPLSEKLSDTRVIHTMDQKLLQRFSNLSFFERMHKENIIDCKKSILGIYINGLLAQDLLEENLKYFNESFLRNLFIKERAAVLQSLKVIFSETPERIFPNMDAKELLLTTLTDLVTQLEAKERNLGNWKEYYK